MDGLKIYFRHHQLKDTAAGNTNVVVQCGAIASYVPGDVPNHNWVEMTKFTQGLEKLQLSWNYVNQLAASEESATNQAGSNYDKGITLDLMFFDDAYQYIWDWLLTNKCQILNSIDVRIDDVVCGKSYRIFEIKTDNLKHRPDDGCQISAKLREQDLVWHDIHKTFIWDDWQGWFNSDGTSTKEHPTFLTCIEPRPRMMNSVRLGLLMFLMGFPSGVQELIIAITDYNYREQARRILDINNFVPAPLIRTYIDNVANKFGMAVDTIFHRVGTPEYMACLFHPLAGSMYQNDGNDILSPSNKYIFENRWNITIPELLDKLKILYNCEWYVTPNNTILFKPLTELINLAPIYDFTTGALPLNDLEYTFDGNKKAAYGRYQYQNDGSDLGSQEVSNLYNDIVDYDGPQYNPMLEGEKSKRFDLAATAFVRDGRSEDYIRVLTEDGKTVALSLLGLLGAVAVFLIEGILTITGALAIIAGMGFWIAQINYYRNQILDNFGEDGEEYTGAVRLVTANQTMTPRILIWDGENVNRAKVVVTENPAASPYYNPTAVPYTENNAINQDNPAGKIFNYPMYFDSKYEQNMFDRFHDETDNPLKSLETNQSFTFNTDLCCEAMDLLGLWENDFVKIGYLILLEHRSNYDVYGRIEDIAPNYETYSIKIKGKVIKK